MSVSFKSLSEGISSRRDEIKGCGANKPGGGGFVSGNSCAGGKGKTGSGNIEPATVQSVRQSLSRSGVPIGSANSAGFAKFSGAHIASMNAGRKAAIEKRTPERSAEIGKAISEGRKAAARKRRDAV